MKRILELAKKIGQKFHLESLKLECSDIQFALIYSILNLILYHKPLFAFAVPNLDYHSLNGIIMLIELVMVEILAVFLFVTIMSFVPVIMKPICMILFFTNALAFYFVSQYNVILDRTMMDNVFNTNFGEASELYHPKIFIYLLVLGVLPALAISRIKTINTSKLKRALVMFIALILVVIFAFINSKTWLWFDKNAKRVGGLSMPFSYIINSIKHVSNNAHNKVELKIPDAHLMNDHKTIVVLVIGESARKANFSLYGYERDTNPYLAKDDVVAMNNTISCDTYTTASIKCMLSHLGAHSSSTLYEALPTYLQRNHVNVSWRSNNWGEPKIEVADYKKANDMRKECQGDDCKKLDYDEVLLYKLDQDLKKHLNDNQFVVLHQTGSHGPQYNTKYPPQFETFKPVCKSVELQKCTHDELVNAYDNTILYTDYFLHQVISLLKTFKDTSSVMIYMSDHGESLGEYNFYLHGVPYSIAPNVEKEIPFIVWTSDKFKKDHDMSNQGLAKQLSHSQDNIFYSVMGAFDMRSEFYKKDLDIFNNDKSK